MFTNQDASKTPMVPLVSSSTCRAVRLDADGRHQVDGPDVSFMATPVLADALPIAQSTIKVLTHAMITLCHIRTTTDFDG